MTTALTPPAPALRSGARTFLVVFAALTTLYLARQAWVRVPGLVARDVDALGILELLALCLPFIAALTLPAAVLAAALHSYAQPALRAPMARTPARMLRPLLPPAVLLALATFALVNYVLPETNAALRRGLLAAQHAAPPREDGVRGDREMSIAELQQVVREAEGQVAQAMVRADLSAMSGAASRAAQYRVEIQKKLAISASVLVLALLGAAVGPWLPARGWWVPAGLATAVFGLYYVGLVGGEALGNRQVLSPVLAMWGTNLVVLLLAVALFSWPAWRVQASSRVA